MNYYGDTTDPRSPHFEGEEEQEEDDENDQEEDPEDGYEALDEIKEQNGERLNSRQSIKGRRDS